ncbi:hypothetical protein P5673_003759 [Acropora cervicornis]|uniref:Uncharacterized protein n=1 Tax=Acropora cervicornis TaxID=6130 RepID=A0AAD9R155_ACRCE|nr:hypothetical protein P5673_003759 [Acropora cervicornis]
MFLNKLGVVKAGWIEYYTKGSQRISQERKDDIVENKHRRKALRSMAIERPRCLFGAGMKHDTGDLVMSAEVNTRDLDARE